MKAPPVPSGPVYYLAIVQICTTMGPMNGREFVRRARRYARRNGFAFDYNPNRGRGSHGRVHVGDRYTTVQHGEIPLGTFLQMLRDLAIDRREF